MKIAIGADHAGFNLKNTIIKYLREKKFPVVDMGTFSTDPVDYPDIALQVAEAVERGEFDKGIIICGTGIGCQIVANKVPGIRAALCHDPLSADFARTHNNANILTLGERIIGPALACEIVNIFLTKDFSGGRHQKRLEKIEKIDEKYKK